MHDEDPVRGPILRLFEVTAKSGCGPELLRKFATTSADVVRGEPGNEGYLFGSQLPGGDDGEKVVFASLWRDLDAVKERFGADWQESFLPEGYEALIETSSIRHIDLTGGWHFDGTG